MGLTPTFAREFDAWLAAERITLTDLAAKLGTNRVSIRHWRTGRSFPRDGFCDKLFEVSEGKLGAFGPGRDAARLAHEQSIPVAVKKERRDKYNANLQLFRGRAMASYHRRYEAKRQFVTETELAALRLDPRLRKSVCRECGEILRDLGPHLWPAHQTTVEGYRAKYGFTRSKNATRSRETNEKQSEEMKRIRRVPPREMRFDGTRFHTNKKGYARTETLLNKRGKILGARPDHWKRTASGDVAKDARIASLRLRDGLTIEEIAKRLTLSETAIFFRLKRLGLPRRARIFMHGEFICGRHLRSLCADFDVSKMQAAELLDVSYEWFTERAKERPEEKPLSWNLGRKYLKIHHELLRKFRTRPARAEGGRPLALPPGERTQIPTKYAALLADLQCARRWLLSQKDEGHISLNKFWDWVARQFRVGHLAALQTWPAFYGWIESNYESGSFVDGVWTPNGLAREFLSDDYGITEELLKRILAE